MYKAIGNNYQRMTETFLGETEVLTIKPGQNIFLDKKMGWTFKTESNPGSITRLMGWLHAGTGFLSSFLWNYFLKGI